MKRIAVLGTGVVAQTISAKLATLGYKVMMGTRNVAETLARGGNESMGKQSFKQWYDEHPDVQLGSLADAAAYGEMIVNATNGGGTLAALELAGGDNLKGKILLDIANPLDFSNGMPPTLSVCNTDSLAEQIQTAYPDTKVVKSLNTMNANLMVNPALLARDHSVFISGNGAEAKTVTKELLNSFGWAESNIIDLGDITTARGTEMLLPVWIRLWGALKTPMFNFQIVGQG